MTAMEWTRIFFIWNGFSLALAVCALICGLIGLIQGLRQRKALKEEFENKDGVEK